MRRGELALVKALTTLGRGSFWPGNGLNSRELPRRDGRPRGSPRPLGVSRQVVIRAHQEQLDEMAELSFKEEALMSQLARNVSALGWTLGGCWELVCS